MDDLVRVHIIVEGRVQGVFFRQYAVQEARSLGLMGTARNLKKGSVEIIAEGEEKRVKEFLLWCKQGPRLARVDSVKTEYEDPIGELKGFRRIN